MAIGNTASYRHEKTIVNEGTGDRDLAVGASDNKVKTNDNMVNVTTWETSSN